MKQPFPGGLESEVIKRLQSYYKAGSGKINDGINIKKQIETDLISDSITKLSLFLGEC